MRSGHFQRADDVNGVSGEGRVAEWVEFTDGTVVVHWISHTPSTNIYHNAKQVDAVHGHGGRTKMVVDWDSSLEEEEKREEAETEVTP